MVSHLIIRLLVFHTTFVRGELVDLKFIRRLFLLDDFDKEIRVVAII